MKTGRLKRPNFPASRLDVLPSLQPPNNIYQDHTRHREGLAVPSYEYQCQKCHKRFTVVERISEHAGRTPACPKCRSRSTRQLLSAFYAKTVKKS